VVCFKQVSLCGFLNKLITESRSDGVIGFFQEDNVDWVASIFSLTLFSPLPPFLILSSVDVLHLTGWSESAADRFEQKGSKECVGAVVSGIHDLVGGNLSLELELNCRPSLGFKRLC